MFRKRHMFVTAAMLVVVAMISASAIACTNVLVGNKATVDGSVIVSWTDDSGSDNFKLKIVPAQDWAIGSMRPVIRNTDYDDYLQIANAEYVIGEIPQVAHTYAYLDASYSFMNEMGVMIAESTIGGRSGITNRAGWFDIVDLQRVALERASTAREAVQIMGDLAVAYGFGIGGESLHVIDSKECWSFEVWGPGPLWSPGSGEAGAVWVAARLPDDQVGAYANRARIGKIDLSKPDMFMASANIYSLAIDYGWWTPDSGVEFRCYEVYGTKAYSPYNTRREWRVLSLAAPSLRLDPYVERYPFSVVPDKKMTVQDVMAICRDWYAGTEFDLTKGAQAGPFGTPNRWPTPSSANPVGSVGWERAISLFRTNLTTVSNARPNMPAAIGSLTWVGLAMPHTTCFVPIYAGVTELPVSWNTGQRGSDYDVLSKDSAWWAFNLVGNIADLKFVYMIEDVKAAQQKLEGEFFAMQSAIETAAVKMYETDRDLAIAFITDYTNTCATRATEAWWNLANFLLARYTNGYTYGSNDNYLYTSQGYPSDWLRYVGFGIGVSSTPNAFGYVD